MTCTAKFIAKAYTEFQTWIRKLVSKFIGRYGGDWDELFAEANYLFVQHCHTWNPRRGTLNKHISFRIWVGLLDLRRRNARYFTRHNESIEALDPEPSTHVSPFYDFVEGLSSDAREIVQTILAPLLDLELLIAEREGPRVVQRALREFLEDWADDRLYATFDELHDATQLA